MKKIILLIAFALLITPVLALNLGLSPSESTVSTTVNQERCINLSINSRDYNGTVAVTDRWASPGIIKNDLSLHNLEASQLDLSTDYINKFQLKREQSLDFCITPRNAGAYHGLILFKAEQENVQIGSWLTLYVYESNQEQQKLLLTGQAVSETQESRILIGEFIFTILLVIFLIYLLLKTRKKIAKKV